MKKGAPMEKPLGLVKVCNILIILILFFSLTSADTVKTAVATYEGQILSETKDGIKMQLVNGEVVDIAKDAIVNITQDSKIAPQKKLQPVNPDMIGLAGTRLKSFRTLYLCGIGISLGGTILSTFGAVKTIDKLVNDIENTPEGAEFYFEPPTGGFAMLAIGGVLILTGTILDIISFWQIGDAGTILERTSK